MWYIFFKIMKKRINILWNKCTACEIEVYYVLNSFPIWSSADVLTIKTKLMVRLLKQIFALWHKCLGDRCELSVELLRNI